MNDIWTILLLGFLAGTPFGFAVGWALCALRERHRPPKWQPNAEAVWMEPGWKANDRFRVL